MIRPLIAQALHSLRHQKLSQDIAFSLGSFAVLAISGIVINIVITVFRDAAALGVFNIAYAVYIVASQVAVWGLHYSVLRHAAYHASDQEARGHMLLTAAVCSIAMGLGAGAVVFQAEPLFAVAFNSETTGAAIRNTALGLTVFPLNKVLIAYLNGLREMRAYAVLQALRYLMIMALVALVAASSLPIEVSTFCFFVAELLTLVTACLYIASRRLVGTLGFRRSWVVRHYQFGTKALAAGLFTEVNSRVDVLMIGIFLSDRATGIYSFAAMLVDGVYHVLAMVRINFNPILVAAIRDRDWRTVLNLRRQARRIVLPVTIVLATRPDRYLLRIHGLGDAV
jgi:Membrane protein involved in the export of O-antigen and teichoic acid